MFEGGRKLPLALPPLISRMLQSSASDLKADIRPSPLSVSCGRSSERRPLTALKAVVTGSGGGKIGEAQVSPLHIVCVEAR